VAGGFAVQALNGGLLFHSFTAYFVFLQAEFGWSRTLLSGAFAMVRTEIGLLGPVEAWLVGRFGPRGVMRVGFVILGTGFIALSTVDSVTAFYGAFALIAVGSSFAGFLPASIAVTNWFRRRRARAMAIMMTGFGVGGLLVPAVTWSLATNGWRTTAFASGVIAVVVGLPAAQQMRHRPEDYGQVPDGHATPVPSDDVAEPAVDMSARQALATRAFWLLAGGHGLGMLAVGATSVHQIPHMVESVGLSLTTAGWVVAAVMTSVIVGQIVSGIVGDGIDKRLGIAVCLVLHGVAMVALASATNVVGALAFAALHGLAWGARAPLLHAIRADYFGRRAYGTVAGMSSLVVTVGIVAGPVAAGLLADSLGDYRLAFLGIAVLSCVGSGAVLLARIPAARTVGSTPQVVSDLPGPAG
jgi:sugar phosphate permease